MRTDPPLRPTSIEGVLIISPTPIEDDRGWFTRTLDLSWLESAGLEQHFPHHNQSRSHRGVLRGLHVRAGRGEAKLVRCASGAVVDHVVDTRPWSPTFRRIERIELDGVTLQQLYLPPFIAHGFQVVSASADVNYLHSQPYEPGDDVAISWADPSLALDWPILPPILSRRDAEAPDLDALDLDSQFDRD